MIVGPAGYSDNYSVIVLTHNAKDHLAFESGDSDRDYMRYHSFHIIAVCEACCNEISCFVVYLQDIKFSYNCKDA